MVFPDDERESNPATFKFLEMAHKWKKAQAAAGSGSAAGGSGSRISFAPSSLGIIGEQKGNVDKDGNENDDDSDLGSTGDEDSRQTRRKTDEDEDSDMASSGEDD